MRENGSSANTKKLPSHRLLVQTLMYQLYVVVSDKTAPHVELVVHFSKHLQGQPIGNAGS